MAEENIDSEELEGATVELDDEQVSGAEAYIGNAVDVTDEVNQTRTKARKKSDGDEELENYSESVQKRINQLTAKRKAASEEADAAVQYAQKVHQENQQIKARLQQLDQGYRSEYEGRVVSQEQQAKRALTEAHEAGDYERVAEAQSALSQVAIEKETRFRNQRFITITKDSYITKLYPNTKSWINCCEYVLVYTKHENREVKQIEYYILPMYPCPQLIEYEYCQQSPLSTRIEYEYCHSTNTTWRIEYNIFLRCPL